MNDSPQKKRWLGWLLGAAAVGGIIAASWLTGWPMPWSAPPAEQETLPPYSESRYLNAAPGVAFIGSDACVTCHVREHQSYLQTAHSRALSDLNPDAEPPDGEFEHALSGRSFRVYRAAGKLRHAEVMRTSAGKEIARVDVPIRYLIGSGNFCRSYLFEVDGFLHESPITWYTSKKKWDMSPGYDFAQHHGFERQVRIGCLVCHAGRVEAAAGTVHRMTFHEKAIGCESCHGPGALHQELHVAKNHAPGTEDWTIVHPGKLPRDLQEAVCASCHLSAAASVLLRGRDASDFRPGRPLSDFRADYRLTGDNAKMTVVGHVEQLRLSACYQKSNDLTCVTCHDPHRREPPKDRVAYHRQQCMNCHESKPCSVEKSERLRKNADHCVACHMPQSDTDIPHIAFTHHRIGRHGRAPALAGGPTPDLSAIGDLGHLSLADRKRNLGLAYLELSRGSAQEATYRARARTNLEAAHAAGLRDGATTEALAEIYWRKDPLQAVVYAQEAVDAKDTPAAARAAAQHILADEKFTKRDFASAAKLLEKLTHQRRYAEDWRLLSVSYLELGQTHKALATLETALAIRPYRHTTHLAFAEAYERLGDKGRVREHHDIAQWLRQHGHD
jgi:hypothetical protein